MRKHRIPLLAVGVLAASALITGCAEAEASTGTVTFSVTLDVDSPDHEYRAFVRSSDTEFERSLSLKNGESKSIPGVPLGRVHIEIEEYCSGEITLSQEFPTGKIIAEPENCIVG